MRVRSMGWALLALVGVALMAACEGLTDPELSATWVLVEVSGQSVPASFDEDGGTTRTYVSDRIRLFDDDSWDRVQVQQLQGLGGPDQERTIESNGTIRLEDGALVLDFVCDDVAVCVQPDRIQVSGDEAVIEYPPFSDAPLTFRYVAR